MIASQVITANGNYLIGETNAIAQNIFVFGTWGGASVEIYCSGDSVNFVPACLYHSIDADGVSTPYPIPFKQDECRSLVLNPKVKVMAVVSNATATTSLAIQVV